MKIKASRRVQLVSCLLTSIFICSFLFRFFVLTRDVFPPSADIAQHATYVNLILMYGFPSWNPYHMVGEPVVRPLGFHYFASFVSIIFHLDSVYAVLYTGLFFSALTSVTVYFFAKRLTGHDSLAFLCAGFYCFNILDIEMLSWGGYPNIAGLALIPLVFYFFLGESKRSRIVTALLIPALSIIDHSSFFICMVILGGYAIFHLVRKGFRDTFTLATPILVGIAISTPYLVLYGMKIYLYTLTTRQLSATYYDVSNVLPFLLSFMQRAMFFIPFLFLGVLYSLRSQQKRFLLFWVGMPLLLIPCYFLGLYISYDRLVYFAGQAMMIFIALGFYTFFMDAIRLLEKFSCRLKALKINRKVANVAIALTIVGIIFTLQLQMFNQISVDIAAFYQIVKEDEYEALKWIIKCTEESDVFVSEHNFGWWVNGYAQRSCLCAIPPTLINLPWQVENSEDAYKILYLEEGYADLINKYDVKYVVLRFDQVSGLSPLNKTETVQLFKKNSDFKQEYFNSNHSPTNSSIFIFKVNMHG